MQFTETFNGVLCVDEFGTIQHFCTLDYQKTEIKRTYTWKFHRDLGVQAWMGHKTETCYFTVLHGAAVVKMISINEVEKLNRDCEILAEQIEDERMDVEDYMDALEARYAKLDIASQVLTYEHPKIIKIPIGNYYGYSSLTRDTMVQILSDKTAEESIQDLYKLDWDVFGPEIWGL